MLQKKGKGTMGGTNLKEEELTKNWNQALKNHNQPPLSFSDVKRRLGICENGTGKKKKKRKGERQQVCFEWDKREALTKVPDEGQKCGGDIQKKKSQVNGLEGGKIKRKE